MTAVTRGKTVTCMNCNIVAPTSWDCMSQSILGHLNARKVIRRVEKGACLFHEGDTVTTLFRLLHGVVLLRKGDHDGNSVVTRMLTASVTFGFRAFMARECHSVSAHCATPVTVCCIPADAAEMAFSCNRSLERVFAQHVAHELDDAESAILAHMSLSVRDRVLLIFDRLAAEFGSAVAGDEWVIPVPILRSDIAAMAGIARESFSRCLAKLEADGILGFHGSTLRIPAMTRFRAAVAQVRERERACPA